MIEDDIIYEVKININKGNLEGLKILWEDYQDIDFGKKIAWDYIFQKVYVHSVLKKQKKISIWFEELYQYFDDITKIAIKPTFLYAKYL